MYIENFIKILNKTDSDSLDKIFFNNGGEVIQNSLCKLCKCAGILCKECAFNDSKTFEKFKQELNEKIIPILNLQNLIEK